MLRCIHTLRYLCICHMFYVLCFTIIHSWNQDRYRCICHFDQKSFWKLFPFIYTFYETNIIHILCFMYKILSDFDRMQQTTDYQSSMYITKWCEMCIIQKRTEEALGRESSIISMWISFLGLLSVIILVIIPWNRGTKCVSEN